MLYNWVSNNSLDMDEELIKGYKVDVATNDLVKKGTAILLLHPEDYDDFISEKQKSN